MNKIEAEIPVLFKVYGEKNYTPTQILEDLKVRMREAEKSGDEDARKIYQNIWFLVDVRELSV